MWRTQKHKLLMLQVDVLMWARPPKDTVAKTSSCRWGVVACSRKKPKLYPMVTFTN